jgi:PAS domain S-box-containing protein
MRAHDWSASPLGPPSAWAQPLKTVVSLMLHSKAPSFLAWGPELHFLYNDAYLEIMGEKHPAALGQPLPLVWPECWDVVEPLVQRTWSGEPVYVENAPFTLRRKGSDEQAWFSFWYSPVYGLNGRTAGLYGSATETTALVLAEKNRKEESRQLYTLFEQTPSFMAVVRQPDHVYELANSAYLRLVGETDLLGKQVCDLSREMPEQDYIKLLDEVCATGKPFIGHRMPLTLPRQGDEPPLERFVDLIFQPITGADGAVSGVFIEGNDVTAQVRAEDALRESQRSALESAQRLKALLEAAPVGIAMVNIEGKTLSVNLANRRIWGNHPMSESVEDYWRLTGWWADGSQRHGRRLEPQEWALVRALQGEEAPRDMVEIEPFGEPGIRRTILNCGAPIRDLDGKITGAVVAQMDITDQVKSESALRESEAKFRTITNAMPQIVWTALADGYHDYYNQQWYEFTGIAQGTSDGQGWLELLHPEDREQALLRWLPSLATGEPYENEYRLRHHSGQYRWTLARALPVRDDMGTIVHWMGTCTDMHEKKLAQEALLQSDRLKNEFLAMLAHELRNPLAPITTAADLLSMGQLDEERIRQLSQVISRQAGHMAHLIDDLLDVSRVTLGLVTLDKKPVDMKTIVTEAVEQVRPLLQAKAHDLALLVPPERLLVAGDRMRLVQVLANLLNNAIKYTPQGGHISLRLKADESELILCVRDNGIGMSSELIARAFELFTQGERTSDRSQGGLGIGLALAKSIVLLHGGTLTAQSQGAWLGSEFTMVLPRLPSQDTQRGSGDDASSRQPASKSLRVMVVDDNADAAQLLGMFLELFGHRVFVEYDPLKALERARSVLPQVCLLDIGLPGMDGYELARQLRLIPGMEGAILAAVTGYGQPQDRKAAFSAGFDFHFAKPVDTKKLGAWLTGLASQAPDQGMPADTTD